MFHLWKQVLLPSPVQFDAHGRRFAITREQTKQAHRNAKLMLSRGVPIPAVWEHVGVEAGDPDEWKAKYAKYTFGHIGDARLTSSGILELRHDVSDPEDVKRLKKVRFVSPKIYPSYSDSRGGSYHGTTVVHSAATPSPVQFWQQPFSLSAGGIYIAAPVSKTAPKCTGDTSRSRRGRLLSTTGSSTVAKDKTEPDADDKGDGGGAGGEFTALIDALRETGMNIPDEVKDIGGLIIAVKASGGASNAGGDDLDLDTETPPPADDPTAAAAGPPMMMSTTHADPAIRAQAKRWAAEEQRDATGRISALFKSGRIDRPTALQLKRQLGATEMSFTPDAVAVCPTLNKIAEFEKRAPWSAWKPDGNAGIDLSTTRQVARPDIAGQETDPAVIAKQEELAKRMSVGGK